MSATVTIPKKEYEELVDARVRFEYMKHVLNEKQNQFTPPPTKNTKRVVQEFEKTGLYSKAFLASLETGLKRSKRFV